MKRFAVWSCVAVVATHFSLLGVANAQGLFSQDLRDAGANAPQAAVGLVIGDICPRGLGLAGAGTPITLDADLQARCTEVVVAGVPGLMGGVPDIPATQDALQEMAPEEDHVVRASEGGTTESSGEAIGDRLANVRAGRAASTSFALSIDGQPVTSDPNAGIEAGGSAGDGLELDGWGFFVDVGFATGDKDATSLESGFDMDAIQVTFGADYVVSNQWILGAAVGYLNVDADLDNNGGDLESDAWSVYGYGSYYPTDALHFDFILGYGQNEIDQARNIRYTIGNGAGGLTTVNQTAFSDTDSDELSARLSAGYDFFRGDWVYGPYARLSYAEVDIDGFRETINGTAAGTGLAVQMDDQDFTSVPLTLGLQASTSIDAGGATLYPQAYLEYIREFQNDSEDITGHFVGDPTQTKFFLPTDRPDRNVYGAGIGVVADFGAGKSGHLAYQTLLGHKDLTLHAVEVGFRLQF